MTTTPAQTDAPQSYPIEKLLSQSVQPFPDLHPEQFSELVQSIKDHGLQNAILLTEDGFLYDGHQRCKALIAIGRKRISAQYVRVARGVNRGNMLEHAYMSNIVRRHLTTEDKAVAMHQCVKRGWSQRKIARAFGMTQPAVSQLLRAYPDPDVPEVIITEGDDGKTYERRPPRNEPRPKGWEWGGANARNIRRARRLLATQLPTGLDERDKADLAAELEQLRETIDEFLTVLEDV